jgi:TM2 domain-containing membrane protein YozV
MSRYCTKCGAVNDDVAQNCVACQAPLSPVSGGYQPMQSVNQGAPGAMNQQLPGADKKLVAGICGILLGGFGVHKFILGYTNEGIIQIVITILTCGAGGIIGIIEGIIYLTKSDEEFVATYIQNKRGWF